ncbi:MAG: HD domain-containing protein [Deltaproteobacteria bacterium]|nr:HD domain-containing protein [Deltaproteobacteria bacterium]
MADEKIKFQSKLADNPERTELARSYEEKLQTLGRIFIGSLYMLIRNVKLYKPENDIFAKPLEQLKDCINTIVAMDESLSLQGAGESFYLNNMLVKIDINSLDNVRYLMLEFERRNVGGFNLSQPISIPELQSFIFIFSKESTDNVGERGVSDRKLQALKLRRFEKIQEILKDQDISKNLDRAVDRKRYALTVYARSIYYMRKYLAGLRGEGPKISLGKAGRFIQDLVDVCYGHRTQFLGLTTLKSDDEYLCFHSVNVVLLSIVFGSELGLGKAQLRDLGMTGMFHDIGKIDVDDEIIEKRGKLAPDEMKEMRKTPIYSVKKILRSRSLNALTVQRIITAFEHKTDFGTPVKDLKGNVSFIVPRSDLGVYSKIIAIADCYDALTSRRPFREAYSSDIALTLMWTELKHKFDPVYLRVFMNVMRVSSVRVLSDKGEKIVIF